MANSGRQETCTGTASGTLPQPLHSPSLAHAAHLARCGLPSAEAEGARPNQTRPCPHGYSKLPWPGAWHPVL